MQEKIVEALLKPENYDEEVKNIRHLQTHISHVFLTGKFAYKIKKPVNFGFLDFTTLEKRKFYCEKELELNRRLSPEIYLEVVSITKDGGIKIKGKGETVEYAVKMKELPQEKIMSKLLEKNQITEEIIDELAKIISDFHSKAKVATKESGFGPFNTMKFNWNENFTQNEHFIGKTIDKEQFDFIKNKIDEFFEKNKSLIENRILEKKIKECHGDFHSGNIFITDKIYIFDAIEFNERFRFSDVASEVAFLAMDLDFHGKENLSTYFVGKYIQYSNDKGLLKLLSFYKCYLAFVRGKVTSFKINDKNVGEKEKEESSQLAKKYFDLAFKYAKQI